MTICYFDMRSRLSEEAAGPAIAMMPAIRPVIPTAVKPAKKPSAVTTSGSTSAPIAPLPAQKC